MRLSFWSVLPPLAHASSPLDQVDEDAMDEAPSWLLSDGLAPASFANQADELDIGPDLEPKDEPFSKRARIVHPHWESLGACDLCRKRRIKWSVPPTATSNEDESLMRRSKHPAPGRGPHLRGLQEEEAGVHQPSQRRAQVRATPQLRCLC